MGNFRGNLGDDENETRGEKGTKMGKRTHNRGHPMNKCQNQRASSGFATVSSAPLLKKPTLAAYVMMGL